MNTPNFEFADYILKMVFKQENEKRDTVVQSLNLSTYLTEFSDKTSENKTDIGNGRRIQEI